MKNSFILKLAATCLSLMVMCVSGITANAAVESYTITYRPGNVGYFAVDETEEVDKDAKASEVASKFYGENGLYGTYSYTVTKNGAIKLQVPANTLVPAAPTDIQAEEGYFDKASSAWGPEEGLVATQNMDFVVDYGKLVNGVEYTIKYVDSVSGDSIAPVSVAQANIDDTIEVTAPSRIVISSATVYYLSVDQDGTASLTLSANAEENVITFKYTMEARTTRVEEIVNYVEGETITIIETNPNNGTVAGQGGTAAGGEGDVEAGNLQEGVETVIIEDEDVPLAGTSEEENSAGNAISIEDEDVPLAGFGGDTGSNVAMIAAGMFVVAAASVMMVWFAVKRKRNANEDADN